VTSPSPTPPVTPSVTPSPSPGALPTGELRVARGGETLLALTVEIAETPGSRARGLMGVDSLDEDRGMAFLFDSPSRGSFYMMNVVIPLDIAFWEPSGRIVDILQMEPCREDPCRLYKPSKSYVGALEVNRDVFSRTGVTVGDDVTIRRI
jgi:uncharacterized membrane protein (UPF0127 family)